MKHLILPTVCCVLLVTACSRVGNYEHAYFARHGATYQVELKGTRRLMAHDPFSAIRGRTSEETLTLEIPRIEGVIEGSEIPVSPGKLRYVGRIVITNGKMKIDLSYDDRSSHTKVPLLWNGDYTLVQRETSERR